MELLLSRIKRRRQLDKSTMSSRKIKTRLQSRSEASRIPEQAPDLLKRLPDDILLLIIQHVHSFVEDEFDDNATKRGASMVCLNPEAGRDVWAYKQDPERPVLDSLQSFAVVDRRVYNLCRPILWKALLFPSAIQTPIVHWIKNLLPRHGTYVKSMAMNLSANCFQVQREALSTREKSLEPKSSQEFRSQDYAPQLTNDLDNLLVDDTLWDMLLDDPEDFPYYFYQEYVQNLSLNNAAKIISQCPHLSHVEIHCPHGWYGRSPGVDISNDTKILHTNLTSLLPGLGDSLRHFRFEGPFQSKLVSDCILNLIKRCPLLESLQCGRVWMKTEADNQAFVNSLGELKHLTGLLLHNVGALSPKWADCKGPPALQELHIQESYRTDFARAPWSICAWAPNLTSLNLHFPSTWTSSDQTAFDNYQPSDIFFDLPELTDLELGFHLKFDYLDCFRNCKRIKWFTYQDLLRERCTTFTSFICAPTFPCLELLRITRRRDEELPMPPGKHLDPSLESLNEYCEENDITFEVSRKWAYL